MIYLLKKVYFTHDMLLQLDKKVAERTLREHKGDAVAAIRHLLHVGNL